MTLSQQVITIALCVFGTMTTRFLPFLVFSGKKPTPQYIQYLGSALPCAIFGMLVVYCLKNVSILTGNHGLPELIAILVTTGLHFWKRQMLLSIAGGTICYMLLAQVVFCIITRDEAFVLALRLSKQSSYGWAFHILMVKWYRVMLGC